jgi:hypothetical protein
VHQAGERKTATAATFKRDRDLLRCSRVDKMQDDGTRSSRMVRVSRSTGR